MIFVNGGKGRICQKCFQVQPYENNCLYRVVCCSKCKTTQSTSAKIKAKCVNCGLVWSLQDGRTGAYKSVLAVFPTAMMASEYVRKIKAKRAGKLLVVYGPKVV